MDLLKMIPPSWRGSPELAEIQRVAGIFLDRLLDDMGRLIAQLDIEAATTGLEGWEKALGIPTDLSLSLDLRRSKIKAKLQGLGVTTPAVIAAIVERFTGGDARVEETPDKYSFKVVVDGVLNPPEDMDAMRHSVAEVKPAHLAHEYAFQYQSGQMPVQCAMAVQQVKHYHFSLEGAQ